MHCRFHLAVSFATACMLSARAPADDWPQFQGPDRNAVSAETGLVRSFPDERPLVRWTASIGPGYGGAAVRDGEVYLLDRVPEEADVLRCFDLETGRELWSSRREVPGRLPYKGSRGVPAVTEDRVYTIGGFGHVTCFDRAGHAPVWSLAMDERFGGELPQFGWAQSPLVHDGLVYVAPLGPDTGLVALDAKTGAVKWKSPPLGTSHSTPVLVELGGMSQLVFMTREGEDTGWITALRPDTGAVLWRREGYFVKRAITAPTRISATRLFLTGGYRAGSLMLEVTKGDDGWKTDEVFRIERGAQIHLPLLVDDHLFLLVNENWNDRRGRREEGGLMCLGLDGVEHWRTGEKPYFGRGAMILADGMLIMQDGLSGMLRLVAPDPAKFTVLASANIFASEDPEDDRMMWAPLALSDGHLLMRSQEELKCVDLRSAGE